MNTSLQATSTEEAPFQFTVNKQQKAIKRHLQQAIKTGDLSLMKKLKQLFNFVPNEELSDNKWTCLHYACSVDSSIALDFLLKSAYQNYKEDYVKVVNAKTSEGWNLVMISSIYGAVNSLNLLLKYGGIKLYDKDNTGLKAIDLAKKYKKESVQKILAKQADSYPPKVITDAAEFCTPANFEDLEKDVSQICAVKLPTPAAPCAAEDDSQHEELFRCGKRLPCVLCSSSNGWLKYSACCGHPMHPLCAKTIKGCPQCDNSRLSLISDVKYPEKAFTLDPKN